MFEAKDMYNNMMTVLDPYREQLTELEQTKLEWDI